VLLLDSVEYHVVRRVGRASAARREPKEVGVKRWNRFRAAVMTLVLSMAASVATAQQDPASPDQGGTVAVGTETWYTQPWVWIVLGVALLVVLLTLFSRGGRTRT
jgi:hypothetical protein